MHPVLGFGISRLGRVSAALPTLGFGAQLCSTSARLARVSGYSKVCKHDRRQCVNRMSSPRSHAIYDDSHAVQTLKVEGFNTKGDYGGQRVNAFAKHLKNTIEDLGQ